MTIPTTVTNYGTTYSVTSIGGDAFSDCSGLRSVTIPNSVISIGEYAFCSCSGLTSVTIGNSVTSIGDSAFYRCDGLRSVTIPNSVTSISDDAFYDCSGLTRVNISDIAAWCRISFGSYCANPLCYARHLYLNDTEVTNLEIPNSVTSIGNYAFSGCSGLTNLSIPNSVTSIGQQAFSGCSGLTNLTIGNSVTTIGDWTFSGCSGLTSVEIPNSVTSIGWAAFSGCSGLTSVTVTSGNTSYDSRGNCNAIIETATNTLIAGCENSVIPYSVTSIGRHAFYQCSGLTSVSIPNSVISIGTLAFGGCSGLTNLTIGNSVTSIGSSAFGGCSGLRSVTIPNSVNSIGEYAFCSCSALMSLTIGNSVTSIGSSAFEYCRGLKNVEIPNSVTSIGSHAFSDCSGLRSVTIPNSVISIGEYAFYSCSGLTDVYSYIPDPSSVTTGSGAFSLYPSNYSGRTLHVPTGTASAYQANNNWYPYFGQIEEMVSATSIILDKTSSVAFKGTTFQLVATVLPDPTTNKAVAWTSSDPTVATVDDYGLVTTLAGGIATITATTTDGSNLSASCVVTVTEDLSDFENYLSMDDVEAFHGDTIVIPVKMTNDASIISFQTDIFLPEGLELMQEDGEYMIDPSPRMTRTHNIMSDDVSNGSIRVLCYSSNYKSFTGNSGDDLFYITVKVADDAEGDYTIQLKNTLLTNTDFIDIAAPDVAANVNVKSYLLGDANNSGTVTVTDVVVTAQYVLERNPQPFVFEAADVNFDYNITVADVSRIAWMVLNPSLNVPLRAPALWNNGDRMNGSDITLAPGETRKVSIMLDNEMDYAAFQLDLNLPEGLKASNFQLTDRAGCHDFDVNSLQNGNIRALCYSPNMTAINGHAGALLTFDVTATSNVKGDIIVDGIELVTIACQSVRLDAFTISVNNPSGFNEVVAGKTIAKVEYFNLAGQQMEQPESGVTLVVTTYTDGTRSTSKIIR